MKPTYMSQVARQRSSERAQRRATVATVATGASIRERLALVDALRSLRQPTEHQTATARFADRGW